MDYRFSKKYRDEETFENLLIDRFSRFDYAIGNYLKERTISFFEEFVDSFLSKEVEYNEKHGYKEIPKPISDHKITDNDLHNIAKSDFGLIYFVIVDEVIVNKIKEIGSFNYEILKESFNVLTSILEGMISNLNLEDNELFTLKDIPNRLDQLENISFDRQRKIIDIFQNGAETNSYLISRPFQIDGYAQTLIEHNLYSPTLSHIILSWSLFVEAYLFSETIFTDYKLSTYAFLDDNVETTYDKSYEGFKTMRAKLSRQELTLDILYFIFKFSFVFLIFSLILYNKLILSFFNLDEEFNWIISIFLLTLVYFRIKSKDTAIDPKNTQLGKSLELIDLFKHTQYTLHLESYHPETLKSQLHNIEKKGIGVPKSMYLLLVEHIKINGIIYRENYLDAETYFDKSFKTSSKDTEFFSIDSDIQEYGDIEIIKVKNKIKWKFKNKNDSPELRWRDNIDFSISTKPDNSFWKIKKDNDKNYDLRFKSEFTKIKHSGISFHGLFYFFENLQIFPKYSIILKSIEEEFTHKNKDMFLKDLSNIDGLGFVHFTFDKILNELFLNIGIKSPFLEKLAPKIFKGEIEELTINVSGETYISDRYEGPAYDNQCYIFFDLNNDENIFSISDITVKSSN
jgi:hypothetical protein